MNVLVFAVVYFLIYIIAKNKDKSLIKSTIVSLLIMLVWFVFMFFVSNIIDINGPEFSNWKYSAIKTGLTFGMPVLLALIYKKI